MQMFYLGLCALVDALFACSDQLAVLTPVIVRVLRCLTRLLNTDTKFSAMAGCVCLPIRSLSQHTCALRDTVWIAS